jgi:apolipoprotein N-acyltransferase
VNYVAALVAGLLLAASDHPLHWWWLQFVAFVPFWWGLGRQRAAGRRTWTFGLCSAAAYVSMTLLSVGLALPIVVAAVAMLAQWALVAALAGRHLDRGPVRGPLAAAAMLTLVELAVWHAVPMFGTAQCFVRPLSAVPWLVAFAAYTGVGGVVFAVTAVQALLVSALRGPSRVLPWVAIALLLGAAGTLDAIRWSRPLGPAQRVGVFGWGEGNPQSPDGSTFLERTAAQAAKEGCTLLVTPETGLWVGERDRARTFFGDIAARHGLPLAIGVWHAPTNDNRIWFFDAAGTLVGEYRKTHLVPWLEDYTAGDGTLAAVPFADDRLGGMICQDDNFTDVARGYGRAGVPLVAVPTNDWPAIRRVHFDNGVFRAIENGYAVARAASAGISALVSPRGEVLFALDPYGHSVLGSSAAAAPVLAVDAHTEAATLVVANVPLGDGIPTVYARYGDTPMLLLGAALVLFSLRRRRSPA